MFFWNRGVREQSPAKEEFLQVFEELAKIDEMASRYSLAMPGGERKKQFPDMLLAKSGQRQKSGSAWQKRIVFPQNTMVEYVRNVNCLTAGKSRIQPGTSEQSIIIFNSSPAGLSLLLPDADM